MGPWPARTWLAASRRRIVSHRCSWSMCRADARGLKGRRICRGSRLEARAAAQARAGPDERSGRAAALAGAVGDRVAPKDLSVTAAPGACAERALEACKAAGSAQGGRLEARAAAPARGLGPMSCGVSGGALAGAVGDRRRAEGLLVTAAHRACAEQALETGMAAGSRVAMTLAGAVGDRAAPKDC